MRSNLQAALIGEWKPYGGILKERLQEEGTR